MTPANAGTMAGTGPEARGPVPAGGSVLEIRGVHKRYGGVHALRGVSLEVGEGEIHALVGENGAGKSTLLKILSGTVSPDEGSVLIDGSPVKLSNPAQARRIGIGMVHQELSVFPSRSVLANLFVGAEQTTRKFIARRKMTLQARPLLEQLGLDVDVDAQLGQLSLGDQQTVEIARVLLQEPRILLLDEPNSALDDAESHRLFERLRVLRRAGRSILYVSHRLEEVFAIADRITVMRNGERVLSAGAGDLTMKTVIEAMIGRPESQLFPDAPAARSRNGSLEVADLEGGRLRGVSFTVRGGEIVGVAGLPGSGYGDLLSALFGATRAAAASACYPDGRGLPSNPTAAARRGISLIPADRRRQGLMLAKDVGTNAVHVDFGTTGVAAKPLWRRQLDAAGRDAIATFAIRASSPDVAVDTLSGGNQQKVVLAKWLSRGPSVVLLDDPTRGIDIGAKHELFRVMRGLQADGVVQLFRSTELSELLGMCDRIFVFHRGLLVADLDPATHGMSDILHVMNTGSVGDAG